MADIKTVINRRRKIIVIGTICVVAILLIALLTYYLRVVRGLVWADWTGFGEYTGSLPEERRAKTLWDWLGLLIIPIVLAIGAIFFNIAERKSERETIRQREQIERELSKDRMREDALQTYLDRMTDLLLKEDLRQSEPDDEVRAVARARTLTTLRGLDGNRKVALLRFLFESGLIYKDDVFVNLEGADLRGVEIILTDLRKIYLRHTDLRGVKLKETALAEGDLMSADLEGADLNTVGMWDTNLRLANLRFTNLKYANLAGANLIGAHLEAANLGSAEVREANLSGAYLQEANLEKADLRDADLSDAKLIGAHLEGANLGRANLTKANLWGAHMEEAKLIEANLVGAHLKEANLKGADLRDADLSYANLRGANLEGAYYDDNTKWPTNFDIEKSGVRKIKLPDL